MQAAETFKRPEVKLSKVLLPTEHGSWAFLLEPLIAGFLLFFSPAAAWLAVMTLAGFFSRQPLKTYFLTRKLNPALSATAFQFSLLFLGVAAVALGVSVWLSGKAVLLAAAVGVLLGAEQFRHDVSRNGRSLSAEVAGAVAISSSAAMMALAGGSGWKAAAAFWAIFALRSVPSIVYVRNRLLLEKGKGYDWTAPAAAHAVSLAAVMALWGVGMASILTLAMFAFLLVRCCVGLSPYRKPVKAMRIGVWEVVYGFLTLLSIVVGYYAGI